MTVLIDLENYRAETCEPFGTVKLIRKADGYIVALEADVLTSLEWAWLYAHGDMVALQNDVLHWAKHFEEDIGLDCWVRPSGPAAISARASAD
jgi:hypothetical protein